MRMKVVNKKVDKMISRKTAGKKHPKNLQVTNTRGGIRM